MRNLQGTGIYKGQAKSIFVGNLQGTGKIYIRGGEIAMARDCGAHAGIS
jgi:hypothetical protein